MTAAGLQTAVAAPPFEESVTVRQDTSGRGEKPALSSSSSSRAAEVFPPLAWVPVLSERQNAHSAGLNAEAGAIAVVLLPFWGRGGGGPCSVQPVWWTPPRSQPSMSPAGRAPPINPPPLPNAGAGFWRRGRENGQDLSQNASFSVRLLVVIQDSDQVAFSVNWVSLPWQLSLSGAVARRDGRRRADVKRARSDLESGSVDDWESSDRNHNSEIRREIRDRWEEIGVKRKPSEENGRERAGRWAVGPF